MNHFPLLVFDWDGTLVDSIERIVTSLQFASKQAVDTDLSESQAKLQKELGQYADVAVLAYPANATNAAVRSASRQAGYELAFGGQRGVNRLPITDSQEILRLPVVGYNFGLFRALLLPAVIALGNQYFSFRSRVST